MALWLAPFTELTSSRFIHVVAFLLPPDTPLCTYTPTCVSWWARVLLLFVKEAAGNIVFLCGCVFSSLLHVLLGEDLWAPVVVLHLTGQGAASLFSKVAGPFPLPPAGSGRSISPRPPHTVTSLSLLERGSRCPCLSLLARAAETFPRGHVSLEHQEKKPARVFPIRGRAAFLGGPGVMQRSEERAREPVGGRVETGIVPSVSLSPPAFSLSSPGPFGPQARGTASPLCAGVLLSPVSGVQSLVI